MTDSKSASSSQIKSQDAGLSSAMHDMRLLAKSYMDHRVQNSNSATSIAHHSTAVDPRVLLLPTIQPRSDGWKIAMLSMMVMVGLSTSAIAVGLIMQQTSETKTPIFTAVDRGPTTLPVTELNIDASPGTALEQPDTGDYEVPSSPETSRATPERHTLVVPPVAQTKPNRPGLRARRRRPLSTKTDATKSCDEVACFLGESGACCGTDESEQQSDSQEEERAARPYRLSRQQVMQPMKSITGRVRSCADENEFQGVATTTLVIAPNGSVQQVAVDQGSESFRSCVESKVRTLSFPKLQQSFTTKYPYILR